MAHIQITETITKTIDIPDYFEEDETVRGKLVDLLCELDGFMPRRKGAPDRYREYLWNHRHSDGSDVFSLEVANPKSVIAKLEKKYAEADRIMLMLKDLKKAGTEVI